MITPDHADGDLGELGTTGRAPRPLEAEQERELAAVAARYADPRPHRFPVAVVFVVPKREAVR